MSKLSAAQRKALPAKTFAGPHKSYPIPDANHARAALALINKGGLTPAQKKKVRAAAEAKLKG